MKNLSSQRHRFGTALCLAFAATIASVPLVYAGPLGDPVIRQISPAERQNLQNQQQRQNFQLRQQIYREQDSRIVVRAQRLEVPVMKPRCRPHSFGNSYIARSC